MKLISMLTHPGARVEPGASLIDAGRIYTRRNAVAAVAHMICELRGQGLQRGHRVLALVDHDARGVFFLAAASALGLRLMMPYNLQDGALPEWINIAETARPDFVIDVKHGGTHAAALRRAGMRIAELSFFDGSTVVGSAHKPVHIEAPEPIDNFLVLFTSGTTGHPKAISISETLVCRRIHSVSNRLRFDVESRVFMSGLLNNTTGVIFSFGALLHDATLIFPNSRNPFDWPAQVAGSGATHIMLRPVAMQRFVEAARAAPVNLASLRVVAYGAAAMPRSVLEEGRRLMPCDWVQGYGLSETYGPFCWLDETGHRQQLYRRYVYCVGQPDDTLQVDVQSHSTADGVGEVVVRGDSVMEGYYDVHSGAITRPDEWLRTGDLGEFTPDGHLLLKGRIANTVMSENGHRIYPEEIEAVLSDVPGITEAVLLGMPEEDALIVKPVACIHGAIAGYGREHIRNAVSKALAQSLSREKWPGWIFASQTPFPKSSNDKISKAALVGQIDANALIEV